jgi:glycine betaine/proline transport system substrate-binding protein
MMIKVNGYKTSKILFGLAAMGLVFAISGCGKAEESSPDTGAAVPESDQSARLTYVNWAEGVAYTHLAKVVLEEKMGYDVEITVADVGPAYIAVASGNYDAFMECWRELHQDYLENAGDNVISLGNVYEGTIAGLAVPTYVEIDTISEMKGNEDLFNGEIVGIDPGAGMMKVIGNDLIPEYDLDITLIPSSGPAMTAAVKGAVEKGEPIVVPAWKPHWMFSRFDLKFLKEDGEEVYWNEGDIEIIGRADIDEDKPELAQFLRNMYLTDPQLSDLMLQVEESDLSVEEVAREWMSQNESVVMAWIPGA